MDVNAQAISPIPLDLALKNAIELWASNSTRPETFDRDTKLLDKISIVKNFFDFIDKSAAEITPSDVEAWRIYLTQQGNKPATVYTRISRLSSFYKWLLSNPQLASYVKYNPVLQARPRCPRPYQSESVKSWSDEETKSIISIVEAKAKAGSIPGKRDYALLLFYLYTGLRRNEVISLRGKDLEYKEGRLVIRYKRKGGKYVGREISQREVYQALDDYLVAANRSEILKTSEPIWIRHDRAKKGTLPLGSRAFANNLKKYAKEAGIEKVHVHQTRHTYARIVAEETGSYLETQEALDHENAATTRVYVQRITVKTDKHGSKISNRLKFTG
jgi:integrase